ncbi:MAG: NAD-dependent epimerase/dehydratase family protein, partial [Haloechinothrix sp.]
MRVLITGVTEQSGRAVARLLLAAGHEVVGLAPRPHRYLDPRVDLVIGEPADRSACARAVSGSASVLHMAGTSAEVIGAAARRAGARVVLPLTADTPAEKALLSTGVSSLIVRTAPIAGRRADATSCRTLASLLASGASASWQLLHTDDLERFLVLAATSEHTGVVQLAAPGVVTRDEVRQVLRDMDAPRRVRGIRSAPCPARLDTTVAVEKWSFRCGWSATEVVEDLARGLVGRKPGRDGARMRSGHIPLRAHLIPSGVPASDAHPLETAAPDGMEGEFDDHIDQRYPVYTATNTSEALPGPMTPLTIDLHVGGIRLANESMGRMLAFDGLALEQWTSRVVSVLGHHVYINASIGVLTAENMPGWDEESIRADAYGSIPAEVAMLPRGRPPMPKGLAGVRATWTSVSRVIAVARRYRDSAELINAASRAEALAADQLAKLTDEQLYARVALWRDRLNQAWSVAALGVMMTGAANAIHERSKPGGDLGIDLERLESARTMLAVERLAALCRANRELLELAKSGDVAGARATSESFAAALDAELAAVGHRGPGECELINPVFGDRPAMLVTAAARAAQQKAPRRTPAKEGTSRTARMAAGATVARERARDAVVRINHCLRLAARERARRLVARGL